MNPLTPMSGAELRAARQAAAVRFEAIAALYLPSGWTVKYRKSLTGSCWADGKEIEAPRPATRKSLYVFLHECAHAQLGHQRNKPSHVEELEAELWAHEKMREHGVPVPRTTTAQARSYVAYKIRQAEAHGARRIDPRARKFAKG